MAFDISVIQSVGVLIVMILLGTALRRVGIIREEHGALMARLVTHYTLPALIFTALSRSEISGRKMLLAVVMIVSQCICGGLAWAAGRLLRLSRPRRGALILGSMFTSSGFLGYAVIRQIYGDNPQALADAAVVSELGVAVLIFTVGVMIAIHFGRSEADISQGKKVAMGFFRSPIFIALTAGIVVSLLPIPKGLWAVDWLYRLLGSISAANTPLVTLTIGAMLHFRDFRRVLPIVALACVLKLIVQPTLAWGQAELLDFPLLWKRIVIIEAAMPTAALCAVFAKQYDCDAELGSILVFATFLSCLGTICMMVFLLG